MLHAGDDPGHPSRMDGDVKSDGVPAGPREGSTQEDGQQRSRIQAHPQHQTPAVYIRDCTQSDSDGKEYCSGKNLIFSRFFLSKFYFSLP